MSKRIGFLSLLDWLISSIKSKELSLPNNTQLNNEQVLLEFSRGFTKNNVFKCFMLEKSEMWISPNIMQLIEEMVTSDSETIMFNYTFNLSPYKIDWNSRQMKQQLKLWSNRMNQGGTDRGDLFNQREVAGAVNYEDAKLGSFDYYNKVDLTYRRNTFKTDCFVMIAGDRNNLREFDKALVNFRSACVVYGFTFTEINADLYGWMTNKLPCALRFNEALDNKTPKLILSDDSISNLLGHSQGIIGTKGVPIGMDIYSTLPVFYKFREKPTAAENILISAFTGGGKSVFVKNLIFWQLLSGNSVCVLDYEGDEYINIAKFINRDNPGDAVIVNMNSGVGKYFDPLRIADPTGDEEADKSLKADSMEFTKAMFRVLLGATNDKSGSSKRDQEDAILSTLITRVYSLQGVTDNKKTWYKSKTLKIDRVYEELCLAIESQDFKDDTGDVTLHLLAKEMQLKLKRFFQPGEVDYGTFAEPLNFEDIRDARFIDFSFGNKGKDTQGSDNTKVALKQLSVSKITNDISNYNKFVKTKDRENPIYTVKVWEEVQRFMDIPGAQDIMLNCITGGRKRNDIAFIITNDLATVLDAESKFTKSLKDNLTGYMIGLIKSKETREKFCETFELNLLKPDLDAIYEETSTKTTKDNSGKVNNSPYQNAFLVKLTSGAGYQVQTIVKAVIHPSLFKAGLFELGKMDTEELN